MRPTPFFWRFTPDTLPLPGATPDELAACERELSAPLPAALSAYLRVQNGGRYSSGMLLLLGAHRPFVSDDLASWNHPDRWKRMYAGGDLAAYTFFAMDAFGNQFGYASDGTVWRLDIQMGALDEMADSVDRFLNQQLPDEGPWLLGNDFLVEYRRAGYTLPAGFHLGMERPALLGGQMEPENLRPCAPLPHLIVVGQMVTQLKPLPPGVEVKGFIIDPGTLSVSIQT